LKFSPGDLVITTEPLYGFNEVVGEWEKVRRGTRLIFLEFHLPSDKFRVILPTGTVIWLDGYEEGYLELLEGV
jgi:hypothetical protein